MARFVQVHDVYESTDINVDHIVRIHAHPGGYTLHLVDGTKYEMEAGTPSKDFNPAYSWKDATKVVDEIRAYQLDNAGRKVEAPVADAPVKAESGKVYKTKWDAVVPGVGSQTIWVDKEHCFIVGYDDTVLPLMDRNFEGEVFPVEAQHFMRGNRSDKFFLGEPVSLKPSVVPFMFLDQFEDVVEVVYALQNRLDSAVSHLSNMNGDLISVDELQRALTLPVGDFGSKLASLKDVVERLDRVEGRLNHVDDKGYPTNEHGDC